jgi:hypothetical protein
MSKGSSRRPRQVSYAEEAASWERIFKRQPVKTLEQMMKDEFERSCCGTLKGSSHRTTCHNFKPGKYRDEVL